jgi:lysophospholipase
MYFYILDIAGMTNMNKKSIIIVVILLILAFFICSCKTNIRQDINSSFNNSIEQKEESKVQITPFKFLTKDGFEIYSTLYQVKNPKAQVLLLHGFRGKQEDYAELTKILNEKDINVITLDFRGHGKSIFRTNIEINEQDLNLQDYTSLSSDLEGVIIYLDSKNLNSNFSIVGSDLGANVALVFATKHNDSVKKLILLSPSQNYYGVITTDTIKKYNNSLYIVTSVSDDLSYEGSKYLYDNSISEDKEFKLYSSSGHGVQMFLYEMGLFDKVSFWLLK